MIFIGPNLNNPNTHFVTNVIDSIGSNDDLILDVLEFKCKEQIFAKIRKHLVDHNEQYIIYSVKENEDFFFSVKNIFPDLKLIMFFSDDEWRHSNYDRYLALFSDCFTVAVKGNVNKYKKYGLKNVFYMRWGCNPKKFYPVNVSKKYDVTFIGAAYGKRVEYIYFLINNGVNVHVFGRGWDKHKEFLPFYGGCPSNSEMLNIVGQSKINLNFIWTSRYPFETTIKGRTLELAACNAFQLSNYTQEFDNYGFVDGENIAAFDSKLSMLNKIHYYLERKDERENIAQSCYEHVLKSLTWFRQFNDVFKFMEKDIEIISKKFKVLVINRYYVKHNILVDDERLDICLLEGKKAVNYGKYDGVIELSKNSSIDNNGLYMMVFGLFADSSDIIVTNFYVETSVGSRWIRFERKDLYGAGFYSLIPKNVVMFSGNQYLKSAEISKAIKNISYIEYPVCVVEVGYIKSRLLRLNYGFFRGIRERFVIPIKFRQAIALFGLVVDKLWQKVIKKKQT